MISQEEKELRNIRTARETVQLQNTLDLQAFMKALAPDYIWAGQPLMPSPARFVGHRETIKGLQLFLHIFPDLKQEENFISASGDTVTQVTHNSGTVTNGFMGLPPTNKTWEFTSCNLFTFNQEGKIKKMELFWDRAYLLGQLGFIPKVGLFGSAEGVTENQPYGTSAQGGHLSNCKSRSQQDRATGVENFLLETALLPFNILARILVLLMRRGYHENDTRVGGAQVNLGQKPGKIPRQIYHWHIF